MLELITMYLNEVVRSENLWDAHVYIEAIGDMDVGSTPWWSARLEDVMSADTHEECVELAVEALEDIANYVEGFSCEDYTEV